MIWDDFCDGRVFGSAGVLDRERLRECPLSVMCNLLDLLRLRL